MKITSKIYALLVSVGDYRDMEQSDLPCAAADLSEICCALTDGLKTDIDNIRALGEDGSVPIRTFARAIGEFESLLQEEDIFLFYFSGHGRQKELLFSDGAVTIESIVSYISRLRAGSKVVILDCCYSGGTKVPTVMDMTFEESLAAFAGNGIAVMASSASDSVSRLGEDGRHSLYTEIVSAAIRSRRHIREGRLSLSDINDDIRWLMGEWNKAHPDRQQHPIYRDSLIGTIRFGVEEYHPYVPTKITLETENYILQSVKPLSTGNQKRLAAFVITKTPDDTMLPAITQEIARQIKDADVFADSRSEQRLRGKTADAIWCYFGHDETDLERSNHYAYTIWAKSPDMQARYYRQSRNSEVTDGIYIFWNTSYGIVRELQKTDTPDEQIIDQYRQLENLLITRAESYRRAVNEAENKAENEAAGSGTAGIRQGTGITKVTEEYRTWIKEVRSLYFRLTDIPPAPLAASAWSEAVLELAGWVVDLAILTDSGQDPWMIRETIKRYERSLERLGEMERTAENDQT